MFFGTHSRMEDLDAKLLESSVSSSSDRRGQGYRFKLRLHRDLAVPSPASLSLCAGPCRSRGGVRQEGRPRWAQGLRGGRPEGVTRVRIVWGEVEDEDIRKVVTTVRGSRGPV